MANSFFHARLAGLCRKNHRQGEMPPLFVLGPEDGAELVNYRARQNYYVVDRLFAAAELRLGGDHQQKVRIVRTDGRPRW